MSFRGTIIGLITLLLVTLASSKVTENLNDKFIVDIELVDENKAIQFKIKAKTLGWVGLGISTTGTMEGSDFFVGGHAANGTYGWDYFGTEGYKLKPDALNNWDVLESSEVTTANEEQTSISVKRLLKTADTSADDVEIKDGNMYILWAIGRNDDDSAARMHTARGSKSINFFGISDSGKGAGVSAQVTITLLFISFLISAKNLV